ncbi:hypothetical protein H311_03916, partial [Anncaliia algerae PRA109]
DSKNKFVKRYESTKDRFIVFLFYFFHRLKLRNLGRVFLEEIILFFFSFKNNRKILNSSKKFIYLLFTNTVNNVVISEYKKSESILRLNGGGPDSFSMFKDLMKKFTLFIRENQLKELNLKNFIYFYNIHIPIRDFDKDFLTNFIKKEDEIDKYLTLEGRNKLDYFI